MIDPARQQSQIINAEVIATLVERYDRAIRVTELQYFPVKIAVLATFAVTALSHKLVYGVITGGLLWLVLTLVLRPRVVVKLSQSSIGRVAPLLRRVPRWLFAAACAVYLWFTTRHTGWNGWSVLVLIWVLDAAVSLLETRQMNAYLHWKEQIAQQRPS